MKVLSDNVLLQLTPTMSSLMEGVGLAIDGNSMNINGINVVAVSESVKEDPHDQIEPGDEVIVLEAAMSKNNVISYKGLDFLLVKRTGIRAVTQSAKFRFKELEHQDRKLVVKVVDEQRILLQEIVHNTYPDMDIYGATSLNIPPINTLEERAIEMWGQYWIYEYTKTDGQWSGLEISDYNLPTIPKQLEEQVFKYAEQEASLLAARRVVGTHPEFCLPEPLGDHQMLQMEIPDFCKSYKNVPYTTSASTDRYRTAEQQTFQTAYHPNHNK